MAVIDELRHLPIKIGNQKRGDMRAIDVGVGHDDDFFIAQIIVAVIITDAAAKRLQEILQLLVSGQFVTCRVGDV